MLAERWSLRLEEIDMRLWLAFVVATPFVWVAACSSGKSNFGDDADAGGGKVGSGSTSGGGAGFSSSGPSGSFTGDTDGSTTVVDSGPCKGGHYTGTFAGSYTSHLTGVGIPIPVTGNVDMDLDQQGGSDMTCHPAGEIPVPCNEVFTLSNGTITGVADQGKAGDAAFGGFPYFCTMTGTLDCASRKLDEGWIQCTYCVGPLADGGMSCTLLDGVLGTTGVGGHFAGPLVANYDVSLFAFVMGTWNGAEALAGNDGGSPGPDGGIIADYLTDGSLYLGPNDFGGVGTWNATWRNK
jgi:hypothetical protein